MGRKDKNVDDRQMEVSEFTGVMMTIFFAVLSLASLFPIFLVFMSAFKNKSYASDAPLRFPMAEAYVGLGNYIGGVRKTGFSMASERSLFITACSVAIIVLLTSVTAWYITRVKIKLYSVLYYILVLAMIVPPQMVMFTMPKMANGLYLNPIYGLIPLYLGFGARQAVFLFCGSMKAIPPEIEEAATTDGCSPAQTCLHVVSPMPRPTVVMVVVLNAMRVWNDYLLSSLILLQEKGTIPMVIQNLKGGYGSTDTGAMMAMLVLVIVPIIIFYLSYQKYIIKGVAAGTVKG